MYSAEYSGSTTRCRLANQDSPGLAQDYRHSLAQHLASFQALLLQDSLLLGRDDAGMTKTVDNSLQQLR